MVLKARTPATGRDKVLLLLKTTGAETAASMASRLKITPMAVRQHLAVLQDEGLVDHVDERQKIGRPARVWSLTPKANDCFPDRHTELAVGMLQAVQGAFGVRLQTRAGRPIFCLSSTWSTSPSSCRTARC